MYNLRDIYREKLTLISRWDFYSLGIFVVILLMQGWMWQRLPLSMDSYYHLSVMRGFYDAGGWVGKAFWEYAPFGRPHLYPPLLHILELTVFKLGMAPIVIARLFEFLIYPALLFTIWWFLRNLFADLLALLSLFLIFSSHELYLAILNNIPFSLAFIFCVLSFYYYEKSKVITSILFLTLAFYSHSLMPWLAVLAFLFYSFWSRKKVLLWVCLGGILLALPLLAHQFKYMHYLRFSRVFEFYYSQFNPVLYLLAFAGIFISLRRKGLYLFFLCLALGMVPLLLTNRDRFICGHGLIPISFLAAVFLEDTWQRLSVRIERQWSRIVFLSLLILVFYVSTPLVLLSPLKKGPDFFTSSWLNNLTKEGTELSALKGQTFYHPKLIGELVDMVKENSRPDDILFSNFRYAGGMISSLSHRATSNAMLAEVKPFRSFDEIGAARFVLWFKEPTGEFPKGLNEAIQSYGLKKAGETEVAYLYINEKARFKKEVIPASVPYWACLALVLFAFCVRK